MEDKNKKITIVSGDGSNLDISAVYDHIEPGKPKDINNKPTNIVIPESSKDEKDSKIKNKK